MAPKKGKKAPASEPNAEEPTAEEPKAEEPKAEEPKAEEPKAEELKAAGAKGEAKPEAGAKEEAKPEAKPEDGAEKEQEKPTEPEKPSELEEDAPADSRKKIAAGESHVNLADTTLNVMPTAGGKMLMSLRDGGFQHLLASARANVGIKAGRYLFEAKIIETHDNADGHGDQNAAPQPKQLVRVGLSTAGSSLILGDGEDNVSFDSEGSYTHGKKRVRAGNRVGRGRTMGLLVNLDSSSPNASTVSLFVDGKRAGPPQALPEGLKDKPLYPTVTYKNVSLHVNFGPNALCPLPFVCRPIGDAAAADVQIEKAAAGAKEVVFPVGLPDEGIFEAVDGFLKEHPNYTELSDRKIVEWAEKSGLWRQRGRGGASNDKPEMGFGIGQLDDLTVSKVLATLSPMLQRSFVVMEVKSNLLPEERSAAAKMYPGFKKVAMVFMGNPPKPFTDGVHALLLKDKQEKAEVEKKKKALEKERKRLLDERQKKAQEAKDAKRRKREEGAEDEIPAEEEEAKEEEKPAEEEEEEAPVVLNEEEKKLKFRPSETPDVSPKELAAYAKFALPAKEEGFDDIKWAWQPKAECEEHLKAWVSYRKKTLRVEDLQPGQWFKDEWSKWQKLLQDWRRKQTEFKDPEKRKAAAAKKAAEKKAAAAEKKAESEEEEGKEKEGKEEEKKEEEPPMEINAEDIDVFGVGDVTDIGNGEPLFANYVYEDWALLSLRFELHLLCHAFRKDLDDAERPKFQEGHAPFYYNKYFRKTLTVKNYGVENLTDLVDMIKDAVTIGGEKMLESMTSEDSPMETFVKLTEEHRRERERRIDAGDETAKLKFTRPAPPPQGGGGGYGRTPPTAGYQGGQGGHPNQGRSNHGGGYYGGDHGGSGGHGRAPPPPSRYGGGAPPPAYGQQKRGYGGGPSSYSEPPSSRPRSSYGSGPSRGSYGGGGGGGSGSYGGGGYGRR